jgi:hypothetical protein
VIDQSPFRNTGHQSRVIFGAAALGGMKQEKADPLLDLLLDYYSFRGCRIRSEQLAGLSGLQVKCRSVARSVRRDVSKH